VKNGQWYVPANAEYRAPAGHKWMEMDMDELLPCPFCGSAEAPVVVPWSQADWVDRETDNGGFVVVCDAGAYLHSKPGGCGSTTGWSETEAEAIASWNRRARTPASAPVGS